MAKKESNYLRKSWMKVGQDFCITVKDPVTGIDGPGVYQLYGVTDDKWQSSISLSEGGKMSIYNDGPLEIHTGGKSQGGVNIQISTTSGDITITANKNGAVRIRSTGDMTFDCDGNMTINSGRDLDINVAGALRIGALSADLKAQTGNMLPEGESFTEKCFAKSKVGASAVRGFKVTNLLG